RHVRIGLVGNRLAAIVHGPRVADLPAQCLHERGLAGAVGADDQRQRAGRERRRDVVEQTVAVHHAGDVLGGQHQKKYRFWRRRTTNTGTPTADVTIPIGSSAGASRSRAVRSASPSSVPPASMLPSIKNRLSDPRSNRNRCGTTRPTNEITPVNAVAI